ncbi:MAG: hypothetical protein OEW15_05270 [Nitrospirota bacterium]|nr:hypothetical protein [Nitrospirota bacterium]
MKIVAYILIGLLVAGLAGAGYFYMAVYKPLSADLDRFKAAQPEFDKTRTELKKLKERESRIKQETAWIAPATDLLKKGFEKEISEGKAEITVVDNRIVLNITESLLFTPRSVTFGGKSSIAVLENLASLLKEFKDKEILIGNMTQSVPAQGRGRKKTPAKDGRTIAAARSGELVKYLVKNGVSEELLVASSYPAKLPDRGFKIKDQKTIIVISPPVAATQDMPAVAPQAAAKPSAVASSSATTTAPPPGPQQKPIPITTAPPKKVQ